MEHIKSIVIGLWRLAQGMYITLLNMVRPKVTLEYPENRGKRVYPEAFRALLTMPHDGNNQHKCTACGICQMNCPNGTIEIISRMEKDEATGRERKVLDRHMYDLGSCIFCALCTQTCPYGAIEWRNVFEHSVFDKSKLLKQLNREGSSLAPKSAPKPAASPVAAPANVAERVEPTATNVSGTVEPAHAKGSAIASPAHVNASISPEPDPACASATAEPASTSADMPVSSAPAENSNIG